MSTSPAHQQRLICSMESPGFMGLTVVVIHSLGALLGCLEWHLSSALPQVVKHRIKCHHLPQNGQTSTHACLPAQMPAVQMLHQLPAHCLSHTRVPRPWLTQRCQLCIHCWAQLQLTRAPQPSGHLNALTLGSTGKGNLSTTFKGRWCILETPHRRGLATGEKGFVF